MNRSWRLAPLTLYTVLCLQDVSFVRSYNKPPTVLLTATHSTSGGNTAAECNGIISWIEVHWKFEFFIE